VSGDNTYLSSAGTQAGDNTASTAGTYTWVAVYSGDLNHTRTRISSGNEDVAIAANTPTITTTTSPPSGSIGDTLTDSATLSGSTTDAGGTIDFFLFVP